MEGGMPQGFQQSPLGPFSPTLPQSQGRLHRDPPVRVVSQDRQGLEDAVGYT